MSPVDKAVNSASYAGSAISVAAGLSLTEWGIVVGIGTALLTFIASQIWQIRKDRREQRIYDAEIADLRARREALPLVVQPEIPPVISCSPREVPNEFP